MVHTVLEDIADEIRSCGLSRDDLPGIITHLNGVRGHNPPGEKRDFCRWNSKTIDTFVERSISHARWIDSVGCPQLAA